MSKSFLNNHKVRGLRNNNPGNLIKTNIAWQGKISKGSDSHFEQFTDIYFGLRAMLKDLINDINKGKNTVVKLINEYAPPHENNTVAYIQSVSNSIGVTPNEVLKNINSSFLLSLSRAILKVELGNANIEITDEDIEKAISMLGDVSTPKLIVDLKKKVLTQCPHCKKYF